MKNANYNEQAKKMVGDGKSPNRFFVTLSYGWFMNEETKEAERVKDITKEAETIEMCNDLEEAEFYFYREVLGLNNEFPSTVMIEDRLNGVIKERMLVRERGIYIEREYDDTCLLNV